MTLLYLKKLIVTIFFFFVEVYNFKGSDINKEAKAARSTVLLEHCESSFLLHTKPVLQSLLNTAVIVLTLLQYKLVNLVFR